MNSLTFAGWAGDDALRVLKTHVPHALQGYEKTTDLEKMQAFVMRMKEQIKGSKFKSLNIKLVGNVYILYLGKSIDNQLANGVSVKEIPNKLIEDCINYISHIKNGTISRTKYPTLNNLVYAGFDSSNEHKSASVEVGDDEDSLDKTEAINNIIRKKTPKTPTSKVEKIDTQEEDDIEYSNIEVPDKPEKTKVEKEVKFEDELEEQLLEKEPQKESQKELKAVPEESKEPVSRKQRRKQMIDDAEESKWENF